MTKKKKSKRSGFNTQKIFKYVRYGALALPAVSRLLTNATPQIKLTQIAMDYTGFNMLTGDWKMERLARGWMPYLGAVATTYGIPKLVGLLRRG